MKAALSVLAVVAVVAIANEFLSMTALMVGALVFIAKFAEKGY